MFLETVLSQKRKILVKKGRLILSLQEAPDSFFYLIFIFASARLNKIYYRHNWVGVTQSSLSSHDRLQNPLCGHVVKGLFSAAFAQTRRRKPIDISMKNVQMSAPFYTSTSSELYN